MRNPKVTVAGLIAGVCQGVGSRCAGRHVLAIEDTSEINYQAHAARVKGLGKVGNGDDVGLFVHPVLAVDADDGACLGLAQVQVWRRWEGKAKNYRDLPIEDKESGRWIEAAQAARKRLGESARMTVIADRESDIYEMWARLPDARTELLIRACRDRQIIPAAQTDSESSLFAWLSALPVRGSYRVQLPAVEGKRSAHEAWLQVRFAEVRIKRPQRCSDKNAPAYLTLRAIEVVENASTVVGKEAPVHWRLLTTHAVATLAAACQCIAWYGQRWHIEPLFRTMKRQGLDIESSLIEEGERLEKLAVLAASVATRTLQLTLAREGRTQRPAGDAFDADEIEVLDQLGPTLEGRTERQKNPLPIHSLAWAAWIIARLGGWKGYASERKPGPITFLHGLQAFEAIKDGWQLALKAKNVCIR